MRRIHFKHRYSGYEGDDERSNSASDAEAKQSPMHPLPPPGFQKPSWADRARRHKLKMRQAGPISRRPRLQAQQPSQTIDSSDDQESMQASSRPPTSSALSSSSMIFSSTSQSGSQAQSPAASAAASPAHVPVPDPAYNPEEIVYC